MNTREIDIVLAWVDGSDPVWRDAKRKRMEEQGVSVKVDDREERYRDWGLMQYWFRGIEQFAPWVRKIHFVTYGHLPKWLNVNNPKLHIVNHQDFIPEKYLPTFSANVIEWNFHRIKGLSENFIYFNDDMFLLQPVRPTAFFRHGKPVDMLALQPDVANADDTTMPYIYLNNAMLLAKYFNKRENMRQHPGAYFHIGYPPMYFFYNLLEAMFPRFTGFYTVHGPSPLKKSTYKKIWQLESELLNQVCSHPFRSREDVNQYVLREYQKLTGNFVPRNLGKFSKYFNLEQTNKELDSIIRNQSYPCICINDSNKKIPYLQVKNELQKSFAQILPNKSSFEMK